MATEDTIEDGPQVATNARAIASTVIHTRQNIVVAFCVSTILPLRGTTVPLLEEVAVMCQLPVTSGTRKRPIRAGLHRATEAGGDSTNDVRARHDRMLIVQRPERWTVLRLDSGQFYYVSEFQSWDSKKVSSRSTAPAHLTVALLKHK